ncbi:hypothetical protein [Clostridium sp.]|uniref:hypothetical protein n=1 Tax=Clostridium sp. TaxID=1506 RepID=UPI002635078D|nr:hypothetical protein [Clostridium sp.]
MKNKKFTTLLLAAMLILSCVVTGCGKSITPKECAQVWWEMAYNDISNASKLNIKDEEAKAILEKSTQQNISKLKTEYAAQGLTITDDQATEIYNAVNDLGKKANVTIEEVSNDGKTAQVKYKSNYVDMVAIGKKASNDAAESVKTLGITDKKELMNKYSEVLLKNLVNELKNATFSTDTKELTYTFTNQNKVWVPENQEDLSTKLGMLISGQV